jgi:deoxycitidine kinase
LQVAKFFEYVKKLKEASPAQNVDAKAKNPQILLPHSGCVFLRDGSHLSESGLKPLTL